MTHSKVHKRQLLINYCGRACNFSSLSNLALCKAEKLRQFTPPLWQTFPQIVNNKITFEISNQLSYNDVCRARIYIYAARVSSHGSYLSHIRYPAIPRFHWTLLAAWPYQLENIKVQCLSQYTTNHNAKVILFHIHSFCTLLSFYISIAIPYLINICVNIAV